jgi:hypothetical protein
LPWQYYEVALPADEKWREIDIPLTTFRGENLRVTLDPRSLERLACTRNQWAGS